MTHMYFDTCYTNDILNDGLYATGVFFGALWNKVDVKNPNSRIYYTPRACKISQYPVSLFWTLCLTINF